MKVKTEQMKEKERIGQKNSQKDSPKLDELINMLVEKI